jgi:hypothetical protein
MKAGSPYFFNPRYDVPLDAPYSELNAVLNKAKEDKLH